MISEKSPSALQPLALALVEAGELEMRWACITRTGSELQTAVELQHGAAFDQQREGVLRSKRRPLRGRRRRPPNSLAPCGR